jgi:hypothetical protein
MNLIKPRAPLETRANFFTVQVVDRWNAKPENTKKRHGIQATYRGFTMPTGATLGESEVSG